MTNYKIINGDCFELIKQQPDNSVDLVITSPPYSDIVNYGKSVSTKKPDDYCDWILPLFNEIYRVLKPSGSFILNINDKCEDGYRSTYIYDLISRNNKETKLKLYDTYIWHKVNGIPNGALKRFRNTTEFIFHFCKDNKQMKFYMDRVLQEPKESSNQRYNYDMTNRQGEIVDGVRIKKKVKIRRTNMITNELGSQVEDFVYRDIPNLVRPDNVVRFSTAGAARDNSIKHPAPYHKDLPLYYINLLTDEGDIVLDPFSGIATTGIACKELNREYIGYELNESYAEFSIKRLEGMLDELFYCVNQYTLDDEFVKSYPNRSAAKRDNPDISEENIIRCYNGWYRSAGGYKWKLEKKLKDDERQ
jgi:site-specific DNA-methyltransferase (adenine-specific)/site-specific DNA-methyltransferase (cytosine-N4-specific)